MADKTEYDEAFKMYHIYRNYIEHEDTLINFRLTWFLTTQAFLFSAYALINQQRLHDGKFYLIRSFSEIFDYSEGKIHFSSFLVLLICFFGFLLASRSYISLRAASFAVESLQNKWDREIAPKVAQWSLPSLTGGGSEKAYIEGWASVPTLPSAARLVWILIAVLHGALLRP